MVKNANLVKAPDIIAEHWLNTAEPLNLDQLTGKVVVLHAFQMLCPGCVIHGLPQTTKIFELYGPDQVQVIGLHSVFEHHAVMTVEALTVFVDEYRLAFPVCVDKASASSPIPQTMERYQLQGTPTLVLIDKQGFIRFKHLGQLTDLQVGSLIGQLISESADGTR